MNARKKDVAITTIQAQTNFHKKKERNVTPLHAENMMVPINGKTAQKIGTTSIIQLRTTVRPLQLEAEAARAKFTVLRKKFLTETTPRWSDSKK